MISAEIKTWKILETRLKPELHTHHRHAILYTALRWWSFSSVQLKYQQTNPISMIYAINQWIDNMSKIHMYKYQANEHHILMLRKRYLYYFISFVKILSRKVRREHILKRTLLKSEVFMDVQTWIRSLYLNFKVLPLKTEQNTFCHSLKCFWKCPLNFQKNHTYFCKIRSKVWIQVSFESLYLPIKTLKCRTL